MLETVENPTALDNKVQKDPCAQAVLNSVILIPVVLIHVADLYSEGDQQTGANPVAKSARLSPHAAVMEGCWVNSTKPVAFL